MQGKKFYLGLAAIALLIAVIDVAYFSQLAVAEPAEEVAPAAETAAAAPQAAASATAPAPAPSSVCVYDPNVPAVENYEQLVTFSDPFVGSASSGVQVLEFFDPNCPHCRTMHPIMKRVIETHSDQAQFFLIPFIVFPHSLNQIEALYVAAQDGKYMEMIDAQFAVQKSGGLTVDELAALAADLGLDAEKFSQRVSRGLNRNIIAARREQIRSLGVGGVPTVMINGRLIDGNAKTVACLQEMIEDAGQGAG